METADTMSDERRYETAIHEAGHYVGLRKALEYFGLDDEDIMLICGDLTIIPRDGNAGSHQPFEKPWLESYNSDEGCIEINPDGARVEIISLFAGHFAELEHGTERTIRELLGCSWSDLEQVRYDYLKWLPAGERPRLKKITAELVRDHFTVIRRIADELFDRQQLDCEECDYLYQGQSEELAEYRSRH